MGEENEQNQQQINPIQLVDTDDLVWQLGQDVVEKLGYRRLNARMESQLQQMAQQVTEVRQEVEQLQQYKEANEKLDEKNKELADTLKREREEKSQLKADRDALQAEIDRRDKRSGKKKT